MRDLADARRRAERPMAAEPGWTFGLPARISTSAAKRVRHRAGHGLTSNAADIQRQHMPAEPPVADRLIINIDVWLGQERQEAGFNAQLHG